MCNSGTEVEFEDTCTRENNAAEYFTVQIIIHAGELIAVGGRRKTGCQWHQISWQVMTRMTLLAASENSSGTRVTESATAASSFKSNLNLPESPKLRGTRTFF